MYFSLSQLRWTGYFRTLVLVTFLPVFLCASDDACCEEIEPIRVQLVTENQWVQSGKSWWIGLRFKMAEGWHTYWENPGESGYPVTVEWDLPEEVEISELHWPYPEQFSFGDVIGYGYEDEVLLLAEVYTKNQSELKGDVLSIRATIDWLACKETCVPGGDELELSLPIRKLAPEIDERWAAEFKKAREALPETLWDIEIQRKKESLVLSVLPSATEGDLDIHSLRFFPKDFSSVAGQARYHWTQDDAGLHIELGKTNLSQIENGVLEGVLVLTYNEHDIVKKRAWTLKHPIQAFDKEKQPSIVEMKQESAAKDVTEVAVKEEKKLTKETVSSDEKEIPQEKIVAKSSVKTAPPELVTREAEVDSLMVALVMAFFGGMILNLMPCVLPVISFKILSFVKMAGQDRKVIMRHGLAFTLGVILSFWVLAGLLIALQTVGAGVGWGFQLQEPVFVGILACILFLLALSLFGVFELGTSLSSAAAQAQQGQEGLTSSFLSGVLATLVSTPCTGPLLGPAIGFAVGLPSLAILTIFTMMALGLAFPYLLLSFFPVLLKFMPKPGAWMETFKQLMGFFMAATVVWLVWVYQAQTDSMASLYLMSGLLTIGFGAWVYGRWGTLIQPKTKRYPAYCVTLFVCSLGVYLAVAEAKSDSDSSTELVEIAFSESELARLQAKGTPVFVDFTAKWCLICQANKVSIYADSVQEMFKEKGVVLMVADWTKNDPLITEALRKFGRNGVPLYLLYGKTPGKAPEILPQTLTPQLIINYLEEMDID